MPRWSRWSGSEPGGAGAGCAGAGCAGAGGAGGGARAGRGDDCGSAALEFITVGLILLIPLVYLVVALGAIQEQTLGVEAAARHVARAMSQASDVESATASGEAVLSAVSREYHLDPDSVTVSAACAPEGLACPAPAAILRVTVSARVRLPLMPPVLGLDRAASIPVEATAVQRVPRTWGDGR